MDIITGYTGTPHITAENDRDINIGIFGSKSYVLQTGTMLTAEISNNNEIKVRDGVIMHQGCAASIKKNTYDSVTINNGSQGMKRIDLLVARYEKQPETNVESLTLKVLQGTPVETSPQVPEHTEGDIQVGDTVADMPLYEVEIDGLNITEIRKVFQTMGDLESVNGKLNMEKIIIVRNNKKSAFRHPQAYGLTPVTCPDLFFDNSEGLFSHSNGAIVCNQDAIIHAHAHFVVASSAHYYTITINNLYGDSELFYSYATGIGGYSGQTSNYFKVKKGDVISLSFGLNNSFSIEAKDLYAELDVRLVCVL